MWNDLPIFMIVSVVLLAVWALADGSCAGTSFCSPNAVGQSLRW